MVVANKVDLRSTREVSAQEGAKFAHANGCLFVETSAKADIAVSQAFEELCLKILDTPELLSESRQGLKMGAGSSHASTCC